jgi:hypothetical protein
MRIPAHKLNLIKVEKEVKNFVNKYDKNILGLDNMFNSTFSSKKLIRNRGSTIYHNNKFSFTMSEKNLKNELKKEQNNNHIYYNNKSNNDNNQIDNNLYENNINNDYQDEYIKNDNNNINDNNIDSNNNLRYTMTMINNSIPNYNPEKTQIIQSIIPESDEFNKIEEPGEPNPSEEMEEEKLCGLIGLDNIGATCYMNATLQCLCNIPQFVNYFKFNKNLKDLVRNDITYGNNSMLCSSFKLLIEQLWPERLYFTSNTVAGLPSYGSIGSNNTYSNKKMNHLLQKNLRKKFLI